MFLKRATTTLYCKVGSLPGSHYRPFSARGTRRLTKPPTIGQCFRVQDPNEPYGPKLGVRLLEVRQTGNGWLYVCERF